MGGVVVPPIFCPKIFGVQRCPLRGFFSLDEFFALDFPDVNIASLCSNELQLPRGEHMATNELVRARVSSTVKNEAAKVLASMGLTVSDACRITLTRIATEKRLPFNAEPNEISLAAIREIDEGKGIHYSSSEALFEDLGI